MTTTALAGIVMIALIFVTLAVGFPIALSIGLGSTAALYIIMPQAGAFMVAAQKMFQSVNSFSLLAIPFFVLAGNLMNTGGIARRLVGLAQLVAHKLPGSLAQTNIVANMLFGATFLIVVDNVARTATTAEIPIGILTSFIGAPIFIYLILTGGAIRGD